MPYCPSRRQGGRFILPSAFYGFGSANFSVWAGPGGNSPNYHWRRLDIDIVLIFPTYGRSSLSNRPGGRQASIGEFIQQRQYDRIGLVIFASEAFSQVPPTLDYKVVQRILDETQVSWDIGLDSGTAIGLGLANGANMLRDAQADSRVIVLLTDGANNSGQVDPLTAAQSPKRSIFGSMLLARRGLARRRCPFLMVGLSIATPKLTRKLYARLPILPAGSIFGLRMARV